AVDRESVAKRPCFLCAENLPPEEEGLQFDKDFTIYCNPFPIVDHHLTIAHREYGLQRIRTRPYALSGWLARIVSDRKGHLWTDWRYGAELRKKCVLTSWAR